MMGEWDLAMDPDGSGEEILLSEAQGITLETLESMGLSRFEAFKRMLTALIAVSHLDEREGFAAIARVLTDSSGRAFSITEADFRGWPPDALRVGRQSSG